MNHRHLMNTAAFVMGGYIGAHAVKGFIKAKRAEEAKREQMKKDADREQILIHRANAVIIERIRRGDFPGKNVEEVMAAQKLEMMEQNLNVSHWDFS